MVVCKMVGYIISGGVGYIIGGDGFGSYIIQIDNEHVIIENSFYN